MVKLDVDSDRDGESRNPGSRWWHPRLISEREPKLSPASQRSATDSNSTMFGHEPIVIEDDDGEPMAAIFDMIQREMIDHTEDSDSDPVTTSITGRHGAAQRARSDSPAHIRNSPISPNRSRHEVIHNEFAIRIGDSVEIKDFEYGNHKIQFLKVRHIFSCHNDIFIRGLPFTRTRTLRGQLPRKLNELCLIFKIDADDSRPDYEQGLVEVPLSQVIKKRHICLTNKEYPECIDNEREGKSRQDVEETGLLVCRWKQRLVYRDAASRVKGVTPKEIAYLHFREEDARSRNRVSDMARLVKWRGGKKRGGSHHPRRGEDAKVSDDEWVAPMPGQKYIFDDMFCGGGGTSSGAKQAGFKIGTSVDHDEAACATYRLNYPRARLYEMDMFDFITALEIQDLPSFPDVVHLSPPCQTFSPAHTRPGQNDDANSAALFACFRLVEKRRPRIFTVEQTFGILRPQSEEYFNGFIHAFTMLGYSLRWRVFNLQDFGLYGHRKRLLIIGSCPGERLPTFPKRLYAKHPRLDEGTNRTIADGLSTLMGWETAHDHLSQQHYFVHPKMPYEANRPLNRCITTGGAQGEYHPDGLRNFTPREMSVLQGFPANYKFGDLTASKATRIVGNAVPPCVAKVLFTHIKKWLENEDKVRQELIVLSDDEDEEQQGAQIPERPASAASTATLGPGGQDGGPMMID